jgi:hypothetical protein
LFLYNPNQKITNLSCNYIHGTQFHFKSVLNLLENHDSSGFAITDSYEKLVFSDLEEMLFKGKTLDEHYERILASFGTSYKGLDKFVYGNIIKALQTIVESKIKHIRRCYIRM